MKKKIYTLLAGVALTWSAAHAIPAKPIAYTFTQSDGTTLTVKKVGDEWHHSYVTEDGYTIARDAKGDFRYTNANGLTGIMAHNRDQRTEAEQLFVNKNTAQMTFAAYVERRSKLKGNRVAPRRGLDKSVDSVPKFGHPRIPVILVQYSDKKFSNSKDKIVQDYLSGSSKSARQFFEDNSFGQFVPQFEAYGPVTLGPRATYGGNDKDGNDQGVGLMACQAIDSVSQKGLIDWTNYDNNNNGEVDVVIFLYAGVGEAQSNVADAVWPLQWNLENAAYFGDGTGQRNYNGMKINHFAVFNEINGVNDNGTTLDGVGVLCHEFSHCLGLPDFYPTTYAPYFGMGSWSLMDAGPYNDNSYTPCGYTAYEMDFMGWKKLETPQTRTQYTLDPINIEAGKGYKIVSDDKPTEYIILENRQQTGWNKFMSGHGLMITHVDYMSDRWQNNTVNNYSRQGMTIYPADGSLSSYNEGGDLWPNGGRNKNFTDDSNPPAKLNSGKLLGRPITDITEANGKITFMYDNKLEAPVLNEATEVTDNSFTASWPPVSQAQSYNLKVFKKANPAKSLILKEDFARFAYSTKNLENELDTYTQTKGWTGKYIYGNGGSVKLSTSSNKGSLYTPAIDASKDNGVITVVVTGESFNNDGDVPLLISLDDKTSATITLSSESTTQQVTLTGGTASSKISFACAETRKRAILDDVAIYHGDLSDTKAPAITTEADTIMITGIEGTTYTVQGLEKGVDYWFRAQTVYADGAISPWSESKYVTTTGGAGVEDKVITTQTTISVVGNTVLISGSNESYIYTIDGKLVGQNKFSYTLPAGIYVVKAGSDVRKLVIR